MGIKDNIIRILEKRTEIDPGYVDLTAVNDEEREKYFEIFGEGSSNLTNFLRTAYNHGIPSIFCCSGHGIKSAYVLLRVTDENIDILRKLGKILSKQRCIN